MSETPTPITPPWNNSSTTGSGEVVVGSGGTTGEVQQGPMELVELLYNPPVGTRAAMWAIAIVVIALAAFAAWKHGIGPEVLEEMGEISIICMSIWVTTTLFVDHAGLPYLADVVGGTTGGFIIAKAVVWLVMNSTGGRVSDGTPP